MKTTCILKRNLCRCTALVAACGALWLTACTDNDLSTFGTHPNNGSLNFVVDKQTEWVPATRSGSSTTSTVRMQGGTGNPLYLHMTSTPGIADDGAGQQAPATRGNPDNEKADRQSNFGLYAYAYTGTFSADDYRPNYFYNLLVKRQGDVDSKTYLPVEGDGTSNTPLELFLPGSSNLMLFALMPNNPFLRGGTDMRPAENATGLPRFSYRCPSYAVNQADICLIRGTEVKAGSTGTIPLTFSHVLTRIEVVAAADMTPGTIKHLAFTGVRGKATFVPAVTSDTKQPVGTWEYAADDNLGDTYYAYDHDAGGEDQMNIPVGGGTADVPITTPDEGNVFYMLPQTLGEDAMMEVVWQPADGGNPITLTASLTGSTWEMGHTVIYRISHKEEEDLIINIYTRSGTELAGTHTVDNCLTENVLNFVVESKKGENAQPYKLQFSTNNMDWHDNSDASRPAIVKSTPSSKHANNPTWWHQDIVVRAASRTAEGEDARKLRDAGWANNQSLVDQETANCYMVNSAGTYRFLAVFGNALKNGQPNSDVVNNYDYRDGLNNNITSPYLGNSYSNFTVRLIWQDVDGLITDVKRDSGTGANARIQFTVGGSSSTYKNLIQPGNALIGAYTQNNELIWSWHIWVTPKVGDGTVGGKTFLKYPIGFVRGGYMEEIKAETIYVRAVAEADDGSMVPSNVVTITRKGVAGQNVRGRYPTFQWGRKEPMWPSSVDYTTNAQPGVPLYDDNGLMNIKIESAALGMPNNTVAKPMVFYTDGSQIDGNLWNASGSGTYVGGTANKMDQVVKSLYDPSPAGYHVPDPNAFLSCLTSGDFTLTTGSLVGTTNFDVDGEFFVTINGGALYIPFSGCRRKESGFLPASVNGTYNYGGSWTAGRGNNTKGNLSSKLCMAVYGTIYQPFPVPTVYFFPGLGFEQSASVTGITDGGWESGTNAWPVIPQKGH